MSCQTNRAPCMTAWAYIIAEKMGFERVEALSLGERLSDGLSVPVQVLTCIHQLLSSHPSPQLTTLSLLAMSTMTNSAKMQNWRLVSYQVGRNGRG